MRVLRVTIGGCSHIARRDERLPRAAWGRWGTALCNGDLLARLAEPPLRYWVDDELVAQERLIDLDRCVRRRRDLMVGPWLGLVCVFSRTRLLVEVPVGLRYR